MKIKNYKSTIFIIAGLFLFGANGTASASKRDRGIGLYNVMSANTTGKGNVWLEGKGTGFIWDNGSKLFLFPDLDLSWGALNFLELKINSRLLSYTWRPHNISGEIKLTIPNNRKIRFWGLGLSAKYNKCLLKDIKPSNGGIRHGATGFYPEGFNFGAGTREIVVANEFDLTAITSYLPFTFYLNNGYAMSNDPAFTKYNQYLLGIGTEFKLFMVDFFLEYTLRSFHNIYSFKIFQNLKEPVIVNLPLSPVPKKYAVWFTENPMFITPGARIHYKNGIRLWGAVSISLKKDKGATNSDKGAANISRLEGYNTSDLTADKYPVTDGFTPFYTDWMLKGGISLPLRYRKPSSEMYRDFILKKNVKAKKRIDVDEELENKKKKDKKKQQQEEDLKRLKEIEERKKKVMNEVQLD